MSTTDYLLDIARGIKYFTLTTETSVPADRQVCLERVPLLGDEPACAKPRLQKPCGGQALRRRQVGGEA